ncbi:protein phosphatase 1 regulatory subunit 3B [Elysia marginata]|uniref:Protein phosphatase 1 regulatory subunit 3B n=1 Tax=Elysia marginata TaxID=1093978 RepID=A0AAV4JTC9_9GAST|nr:protein phosphatase 1 regulatory subunit 3B [Elysia marginata]
MYFCPCPCSDPHDPEAEETARVVLPRNLSYVQESYLDRYSVSAGFVHDPKTESSSLRCEQQLAQEAPGTLGTESGTGDRTPLTLSSPSNVISPNVEDETVALLSILKAKEFHGERSCSFSVVSDSQKVVTTNIPITSPHTRLREDQLNTFNGVGFLSGSEGAVPFSYSKWTANSIGFLDERSIRSTCLSSESPSSQPDTSFPSNQDSPDSFLERQHSLAESSADVTTQLSTTTSSTSSVALLLSPASRVASRLSSLLQTPPNESMEAERNGTSVDGDRLSTALRNTQEEISITSPCQIQAPIGLGQDMDRGEDLGGSESTAQVESNGSSSDNLEANVNFMLCDSLEEKVLQLNSESGSFVPPRSEMQNIKMTTRHKYPAGFPPENDSMRFGQKTSDVSGIKDSPDSDAFSEEGVFVNMMDDILVADGCNENEGQYSNVHVGDNDGDSGDENDKSVSTNVKSDETCMSVDSMFMSPEEGELEEDISVAEKVIIPVESSQLKAEPPKKMSLQEAISRAASDLSRMSIDLYGSEALRDGRKEGSLDLPDDANEVTARSNLSNWGRSSPLRTQKDLKLTISDYSSSSSSSLASEQTAKVDYGSTDLGLMDSTDHGPESPVYEENEFNFNRKALRKSSSLKTNKTPPGTPHRKKAVRFADAMGLDLESVRHVLNTNSPPKIPPSAMADLQAGLSEDRKEIGSKYLCPCFNQPGASDDFYQRVMAQKVCLENAIITDLTITGFVRVANISYHKSVRVRYTDNAWATFHDIAASYVQSSCDGPTDRFSFSLVAPAYFVPGHRLEFAVSYNADGNEYWDNNGGRNYMFECFAKTVPTESESAWIHFL